MNHIDPNFIARSQAAFMTEAPLTMADIKRKVADDGGLSPTQKRDLTSALTRVEELFQHPLTSLTAKPTTIRQLFADASATQLCIGEKTLANIRSLVVQAMRRYCPPATRLTRRIPIASCWQTLLDRIETDFNRQALFRLATFCSAMTISPEQVDSDTLIGLHAALVNEEAIKAPRSVLKNTISNWNRAARTVAGWPQTKLSSPFTRVPWTLPLTAFPASFEQEVTSWADTMLNPDPLDDNAPAKPLRPATVKAQVLMLRQFASALVQGGTAVPEDVASISALLTPERFRAAISTFLDRQGRKKTLRLHTMAKTLRLIAKHHCGFNEPALEKMAELCKRLDPGGRHQMTAKNRERLRQFDNSKNVARLLNMPECEAAMASKMKNPLRAAKAMERAVAIALLIHYGLRLQTLRTLEVADFQRSRTTRCQLFVPAEKTKNSRPLEFELSDDLQRLLGLHLSEYRPRLAGADGPYLFPGTTGGPRSKNAMYEMIRGAMKKDAGLVMNPHLFRAAMGKIVVEQDPSSYLAVSRVLGHASLDTTMAHYLGTESKAAARHMDRLLSNAKTEGH